MQDGGFWAAWHEAATTSVGLFWTAFWAFGLGYTISALIQVLVTRERMSRHLGETGPRTVALGTFFGFVSSSCSFAALAGARALFAKGAGLIPSLAFLLASTNLVVELGIVIAVFLSWQFVLGEYLGGLMLIGLVWLLVRATWPGRLVEAARERARRREGHQHGGGGGDWRETLTSRAGWRRIARRYVMEWGMVWKDVTVGFTVAGVIAAFVPKAFFQALFVGAGEPDPAFWQVALQTLVGPLAAFFTFIGSMGNIPLAAVLYENGVSFAGLMAFIFSDLVVLPVLRIQARYYGWAMALYILGVFLAALVATALALHYGFAALDLLPPPGAAEAVSGRDFFKVDYTLFLNLAFLGLSAAFLAWKARADGISLAPAADWGERVLSALATLSFAWLAGGLALAPLMP